MTADSDIPYYIAILYSQKEDWNNAKSYLEKSLAIDKNNTKSLDFLQSVNEQLSLKSLNEAIALYEAEKSNYLRTEGESWKQQFPSEPRKAFEIWVISIGQSRKKNR